MLKKHTVVAGAIALTSVFTFSGCILLNVSGEKGSGVAATEERIVDEFEVVSFSGAADATIYCGKDEHVVAVTIDDNLLDNITTVVDNGSLDISSKESYSTNLGLDVEITTATVKGIECSGACDTKVVDVQGDSLRIDVSGACKIKVTGTVDWVTVDMSGAGKVDLSELNAKSAKLELSGASKATVNASEDLEVNISGVGTVSYLGDPEVKQEVSGLGSVKKIEE